MGKYIKQFILLCIITFVMAPSYALSFDNLSSSRQPAGFRGINWGESKSGHSYLFSMYDNVDGVETFNRELENLTLGKVKLKEINYYFYHDRFYQVSLILESGSDHQALLKELTDLYGKPVKEAGTYIWKNDTVEICLLQQGAAVSYLPILNIKNEKNKNDLRNHQD